jgi:hypothetical protein
LDSEYHLSLLENTMKSKDSDYRDQGGKCFKTLRGNVKRTYD